MAGIATATPVQVVAAVAATIKLLSVIQGIANGPLNAPAGLGAAQITAINALIVAQVAAIALLNTV
jgi:hypothetical protein